MIKRKIVGNGSDGMTEVLADNVTAEAYMELADPGQATPKTRKVKVAGGVKAGVRLMSDADRDAIVGYLGVLATGSTTRRSADRRAADTANVLDFGADATGVNDSRAAFQLALDAGGRVVIPPGVYLIGGTLNVPSNRTIEGHPNAILKRVSGAAHQDVLQLFNASNVTIEGLTYDFNDGTAYHRVVGFNEGTSENIRIRNCTAYDSVRGETAYPEDRWFVVLNGTVSKILIEGNTITGEIQLTASLGPVDGLRISKNHLRRPSANGISLVCAHGDAPVIQNVVVEGNIIDTPVGCGIVLGPDAGVALEDVTYKNITIANNVITGVNDAGSTFGIYARLSDLGVTGLNITGNTISCEGTETARGIRLENDLAFADAAFRGVNIANNIITGGAVAIELSAASAPNVTKNQLIGPAIGVALLNKADDAVVEGNLIGATGIGLSIVYAGRFALRGNNFIGWGNIASSLCAVLVNPTAVGAGALYLTVQGNDFCNTTGTANLGVRILSVAGVTYTTRLRGNDFTGLSTPLDSAVANQPSSSLDNIGLPNTVSRRAAAAPVAILGTDDVVCVTATGAAVLPHAALAGLGKVITVKSSAGVTTTVTPYFGQTVEGGATDELAPLESGRYVSDGVSNWDKI